jgi:putative SOS response-associated peptidase YedK
LGEQSADKDALLALLKPFPVERMRAYAISTRVNTPKNDDASLLEAVVS